MRIPPRVLHKAARIHPLLRTLVPVCRAIEPALQELEWIRNEVPAAKVPNAVMRRGVLFEPLQYVLGSQPFGELDIRCRKGVLIPRWETEEWCLELTKLVRGRSLTVIDYCTGTGCIALALAANSLKSSAVHAVDISPVAVGLAQRNADRYKGQIESRGNSLTIHQGDVLLQGDSIVQGGADLVVANPPYVTNTLDAERSVRLHEPHLALKGNLEFYEAIFRHAHNIFAQGVVMEVGESAQIEYSRELAAAAGWVGSRAIADSVGKPRVVALWRTKNHFLEQYGVERAMEGSSSNESKKS